MRTRERRAAELAWVERTLELTLRSLSSLAETSASAAGVETVSAIRDLADHAAIWAERVAALGGPGRCDGGVPAACEAERVALAALRGRIASGLAARLREPDATLDPETRRAALSCAPDLERHARRAAAELRVAERQGLAERIRRARDGLPSRREFLREPFGAERSGRVPDADSPRPCPTAPRRAFSAA